MTLAVLIMAEQKVAHSKESNQISRLPSYLVCLRFGHQRDAKTGDQNRTECHEMPEGSVDTYDGVSDLAGIRIISSLWDMPPQVAVPWLAGL